MTIKNYEKLKKLEDKRAKWMAEVADWRRYHVNHPNFRAINLEEQKFQRVQDKIDRQIHRLIVEDK